MKKIFAVSLLLAVLLVSVSPVQAGAPVPWNNHAAPWAFVFGNHIDTHQQSQKIDGGMVSGFLYIVYTGEQINGIPVATHADCGATTGCVAGWSFQGIPAQGTVTGFDAMGMATFCTVQPTLPGYSHFHWLGSPDMDMGLTQGATYSGYVLKLVALGKFYFRHMAGSMPVLVTPGVDTVSHANIAGTCQ